MGLIKKIRGKIIQSRVKNNEGVNKPLSTKNFSQKIDMIGTAESRKLFSENKGLLNILQEISKEIGILSAKGPIKQYNDPQNRFQINLIKKNKILTIGNKSTSATYLLQASGKKYNVVINSNITQNPFSPNIISIQSEIARKAGLNVIEPIKGLSIKGQDKTIMIYADFSSLKSAREALSPKMKDALKIEIEKMNSRIDKTIKEKYKELSLTSDSQIKISLDNFLVNPTSKKIFIIF